MLLKPFQKETLSLLKSETAHLVCTTATGSGKGLILEKLAENQDERILLITPLIALARQQAQRFAKDGTPILQSLGKSKDEENKAKYRVWIISPEKLASEHIQDRVRDWSPTLVAVDECHCVWEWGAGFRPSYEKIPVWIRDSGFQRTLWMSATLPKTCFLELSAHFPKLIHVGGFSLPESLHYRIQKIRYAEREKSLLHFLESKKNLSGIVFTLSRKTSESLHRILKTFGFKSVFYHAGLSKEERVSIESRIGNGEKLVVLATNAFGLGMDFRGLDFVCAYQPSFNLLSLIQALGRAGRHARGDALVFYHEEDFRILSHLFGKTEKDRNDFKVLYGFLKSDEQTRERILRSYFA